MKMHLDDFHAHRRILNSLHGDLNPLLRQQEALAFTLPPEHASAILNSQLRYIAELSPMQSTFIQPEG
jgi:hypothetical protein